MNSFYIRIWPSCTQSKASLTPISRVFRCTLLYVLFAYKLLHIFVYVSCLHRNLHSQHPFSLSLIIKNHNFMCICSYRISHIGHKCGFIYKSVDVVTRSSKIGKGILGNMTKTRRTKKKNKEVFYNPILYAMWMFVCYYVYIMY